MKGTLLLEDGQFFEGVFIGKAEERAGEVVLHTAVVGYQEMMTDPANAGKIPVLTYPLIGNYGMANRFNESERCWIAALILKEPSRIYSNWQAEESFSKFLDRQGVVAMGEVDTRTLTVKIRDDGEMWGIVSGDGADKEELLNRLKDSKRKARRDWIREISVKQITEVGRKGTGPKIAILDLGVTYRLLDPLKDLASKIWLLPHTTEAEVILGLRPEGLIVSNGPEEDEAIPQVVETVRKVIGKIPLLGISTGHQILCLALGGKLKRMKVGHHGANYPVISPSSFKGEITFQNHSFVADEESLRGRSEVQITLRNLNDQSVEEWESRSLKMISIQYYPLSPGIGESNPVFMRFLAMIAESS